MSVVLATPFYDIKGFAPYISSLADTIKNLSHEGIEYDYWQQCGNPYVDDARNCITAEFMNSDYEYLVFLDSDMSWEWNDIANLINSPHPIVSGCYQTKENPPKWTYRPLDLEDTSEEVKCSVVPAGFLKVHRSVFDKMYREHPCKGGWWSYERKGDVIYREDVAFGYRAVEMGFDLIADRRIAVDHWGTQVWRGKHE
jgi:hypothetical protein